MKHAHWIKTPSPYHFRCLSCGVMTNIKFHSPEEHNYCWHCGAIMDENFMNWLYDKTLKCYCKNYQFCVNCEISQYKEVDQKCYELTAEQKREILMKVYESDKEKRGL